MQHIPATERTACADCPLRKNPAFRVFEPDQLAFIKKFKTGEITVPAGASILIEGEPSESIYTVLKGWGFRSKTLDDGRLQILNFIMPGDLIGLQGAVLEEMGHSVDASSDMVLCTFDRRKLWTLFAEFPSLAYDLTWLASREERLLDEHLVSLGRRSALERIAHLLVLMHDRAVETGAAPEGTMPFPFSQQQLADTLGLSLVHTNKTLRKLTDRGVMAWRDRSFVLLDREALCEIAKYDYTIMKPRPFI